jgi:putative multiple sugar transport system substrate-binding protein
MKLTRTTAVLAAVLVSTLGLSACGGGRGAETSAPAAPTTQASGSQAATDGASGSEGFAADATIGVALPWLGTQNWKEAETMFDAQLREAGFTPLIQTADQKVPQQQQQIEAMIEQGAKVIVVGPVDGTQLGSVLSKASDAGVAVIGYDRLIENTEAVDAVVQFGSIRTGELQGESLLEGLEATGPGPYNIELFGGGPADPNAPNFFEGAMSVLQPKIDDGTLVVVSGQTDFTQVATPDWDNAKAQARMDSLLSGFYADKEIHGVLSPNDGIARAILTSVKQAGQTTIPVVNGLDAENESIVSIAKGEQYSTVAKPTDALVAKTVELIQALQSGSGLPAADAQEPNGAKDVDIYQLDPIVVTKDNAAEVFADDADRLKLFEDNLAG